METLMTLAFLAGVGLLLYRYGKQIGSRKGFGVGLRRGRRSRRR